MQAHTTVLLTEAVDALVVDPEGRYIDCTYGRGGHSQEIASRLAETGRLIGTVLHFERLGSDTHLVVDIGQEASLVARLRSNQPSELVTTSS